MDPESPSLQAHFRIGKYCVPLCASLSTWAGGEMSTLYYDPNEAVQEDDNYLYNLHLKHHEDLIIIAQETEDEAQSSE